MKKDLSVLFSLLVFHGLLDRLAEDDIRPPLAWINGNGAFPDLATKLLPLLVGRPHLLEKSVLQERRIARRRGFTPRYAFLLMTLTHWPALADVRQGLRQGRTPCSRWPRRSVR